jgi:hypothetical protein
MVSKFSNSHLPTSRFGEAMKSTEQNLVELNLEAFHKSGKTRKQNRQYAF